MTTIGLFPLLAVLLFLGVLLLRAMYLLVSRVRPLIFGNTHYGPYLGTTQMGVSKNKGPQNRRQYTIILTIKTSKEGPKFLEPGILLLGISEPISLPLSPKLSILYRQGLLKSLKKAPKPSFW